MKSIMGFLRDERKRSILFLIISGVAVITSLFPMENLPVSPAWIAVALCGVPIVKEAAVGLFTRFDIKADLLVTLALIASLITGQIFAAGEVALAQVLRSLLFQ